MKHLFCTALTLLLLPGLLGGCAQNAAFAPSPVPSPASGSLPAGASSAPDEAAPQSGQSQPAQPAAPETPAVVHINAGQVSAQPVDTSGVGKISEAVRVDQPKNWELPWFTAYEGGYVFTEKISPGDTVTRYDLAQSRPAISLSFEMEIMDPWALALSQDKMVFSPCNFDEETGCFVTSVTLLDFAGGQCRAVYKDTVGVYDVNLARLNSDDFAFFYIDGQRMQRVVFYQEGSGCTVLYEAPYPEENSAGFEQLFAVCGAEEKVWLLLKRQAGDEAHLHCLCIGRDGHIMQDYTLDALDRYTKPDYNLDQITVCGDHLFIKFYSCRRLPPFAALHLDGEEARLLSVPDPYPCRRLASEPVNGRYLVFTTYADGMNYTKRRFSSDIAIFDLETQGWTTVKLTDNNDGEVHTACSSDGQLLFFDAEAATREEWFTAELAQFVS